MSKLGSLYIELGEPEGELCGCDCEVGNWAADEIMRLRAELEKYRMASQTKCERYVLVPINPTDEMLDSIRKTINLGYVNKDIAAYESYKAMLSATPQPTGDRVRELEAKILALPRYSFLSPKEGGVRRYEDTSGAWIERWEVIKLLEAMKEDNKCHTTT